MSEALRPLQPPGQAVWGGPEGGAGAEERTPGRPSLGPLGPVTQVHGCRSEARLHLPAPPSRAAAECSRQLSWGAGPSWAPVRRPWRLGRVRPDGLPRCTGAESTGRAGRSPGGGAGPTAHLAGHPDQEEVQEPCHSRSRRTASATAAPSVPGESGTLGARGTGAGSLAWAPCVAANNEISRRRPFKNRLWVLFLLSKEENPFRQW